MRRNWGRSERHNWTNMPMGTSTKYTIFRASYKFRQGSPSVPKPAARARHSSPAPRRGRVAAPAGLCTPAAWRCRSCRTVRVHRCLLDRKGDEDEEMKERSRGAHSTAKGRGEEGQRYNTPLGHKERTARRLRLPHAHKEILGASKVA